MDIDAFFKQCNLKCVMTHAPYYNLLLSAERRIETMETALLRSIEATNILGAEICAVHPRSYIIDGEPRDTAVDRKKSLHENIISFQPLVKECEKFGVLLGIENLMRYPYAHPYFYSWIAEDQVELIDKLNSKNVCAIWDFGHSQLVDYDKAQAIRELGKRIKGTHVHGNWGTHGLDLHLPPLISNNDWDSVIGALREQDYQGYLTLEVDTDPQKAMGAYMRYLYESVSLLWEKIK